MVNILLQTFPQRDTGQVPNLTDIVLFFHILTNIVIMYIILNTSRDKFWVVTDFYLLPNKFNLVGLF